jgi:hypothetical protein
VSQLVLLLLLGKQLNRKGSRQLHSSAVIHEAKPFEKDLPLDSIADLESLITKEGFNQIYMAAWYKVNNGVPTLNSLI